MATRLFPLTPSSPAFPAGRAWGVDRNHLALSGVTAWGSAGICVPSNGSFVNLLTGAPLTAAGSPTAGITGPLGPTTNFATTTGQACVFPTMPTTLLPFTFACFCMFNTLGSGGGTYNALIALAGANSLGIYCHGSTFIIFNGADVSSGITLSNNVPYFLVGSITNNNAAFLVLNLSNWTAQTAAVGTGGNIAAPSSTWWIGNNSAGTNETANAKMAAAAILPTFLRAEELMVWAADPWSLWYPQPSAPTLRSPGFQQYRPRTPIETRYVRRDTFDVSLRSQADVYQFAPLLQIQPSPAQNQNYDWPNPLTPERSVELRTWIRPATYSLVTLQASFSYDWPLYKPLTTVPPQWIWPTPTIMLQPAFGTGKRRPLFIAGKGGFPPSYWPDGNG